MEDEDQLDLTMLWLAVEGARNRYRPGLKAEFDAFFRKLFMAGDEFVFGVYQEDLVDKLIVWWETIATHSYQEQRQIMQMYTREGLVDYLRSSPDFTDVGQIVRRRVDAITNTTIKQIAAGRAKGMSDLGIMRDNTFPRLGTLVDHHLISAQEFGANQAAGSFPVTPQQSVYKRWATQRDRRVRDSHVELEGVKIPLAAVFSNGCRYPGDPLADIDETANCRCFLIYSVEG